MATITNDRKITDSATNSMGKFRYEGSIPADVNFLDIDGPDGLVSYEDVFRFINMMRSMEEKLGTPSVAFADKDVDQVPK